MPEEAIVLEQYEIASPLGDLSASVADCMDGVCAIKPGPCFNIPVGHAPFADARFRSLDFAANAFKAAIDVSDIDPAQTVFIYCCAKGDISAIEPYVAGALKTSPYSPLPGSQAAFAQKIMLPGAARTMAVSCACASGAIAVESAKELLQSGAFSHALIFGFDAVSRFVVSGFQSLGALSPTRAMPFDAARNGLTIGEGACAALVSRRVPFTGDITIAGAGSSNDANHRTGPSRTGEGLARAARAALADARISSMTDIGAIKCHGTATPYNDAMEAKAIDGIFGPDIPPCFSLKGAIGHTSGAGSLLETIMAAVFLERHAIPPTAGFQTLGVDEKIPISAEAQRFENNTMLCLSAGFGGINAALILRETDA